MPFISESIDFEGVTLIFIESDLETSLEGVVYWLSLVFDRTGVLGGMNIMSWLLFDEDAARELCEVGCTAFVSVAVSFVALFFVNFLI